MTLIHLWADRTEPGVHSAKVDEILAAMGKAGDVAGLYDATAYVRQAAMRDRSSRADIATRKVKVL